MDSGCWIKDTRKLKNKYTFDSWNKPEDVMTYLWHEERGKKFYKVQTDEREIARKIKRRNGFHLCGFAVNTGLWIFSCEFSRPDIAKKTLKSITGKNVKIDSEGTFVYE